MSEPGVPYAMVDVFGEAPLTGNPLAVVDLTDYAGLADDSWLAAVAREFNQAETTFVLPGTGGADRLLRSFTMGGVEVYGAGHNALGAWWWLIETARVAVPADRTLVQRIGGRDLPVVVRDDGWLAMRQEPARFGTAGSAVEIAPALGLAPTDLLDTPAPRVVDTGAGHLMVLAATREAVAAAAPEPDRLVAVAGTLGAEGVYLVWRAPDGTAHARFFNPGVGLAEDSATGTAAGPLAAYLRAAGLLDADLLVRQGEDMGRPSTLRVSLPDGTTPVLSGRGFTTMAGMLRTG